MDVPKLYLYIVDYHLGPRHLQLWIECAFTLADFVFLVFVVDEFVDG